MKKWWRHTETFPSAGLGAERLPISVYPLKKTGKQIIKQINLN